MWTWADLLHNITDVSALSFVPVVLAAVSLCSRGNQPPAPMGQTTDQTHQQADVNCRDEHPGSNLEQLGSGRAPASRAGSPAEH